jgi:hypothetical protein
MRLTPTKPEWILLLACTGLLLAALFGPHLAQPGRIHDFADQRALWGIPCALDVLSNLPFAIAGWLGLVAVRRVPATALHEIERACANLFFAGLVVTAAGSAWYHQSPTDLGLAIDREAMSVAFAGLLGLLAATRISARAGGSLAVALLVLAPVSVLVCLHTGNVLPWALVQFGGIALLLLLVLATGKPLPGALPVRWSLVLLAYAVAKLFEVNDHAVYEATGQLFSGHTLKHVIAAFAAWPVIAALAARSERQNGRQPAAHAA